MDDNTNYTQLELETIFANDFKTSKFILLAQFYFNTHDFERAAKVCEIGLENHGNNLEARFMLAKIYLLNNQITKAEKFLNTSLDQQLISNTMLKLLIEIRDSLNRNMLLLNFGGFLMIVCALNQKSRDATTKDRH